MYLNVHTSKPVKVCFNKTRINADRKSRTRKYQEDSSEDETVVVKNKKFVTSDTLSKQHKSVNSNVTVSFKSDRASSVTRSDQGATAYLETETEVDKDARAIFERSLQEKDKLKGKCDDKIYRGLSSYVHDEKCSGSVRPYYKGPMRASFNIRPTCNWDYQPDICKDYKETGYCGFGDSCKFLHDRTDYKYGWEMEQNSNKNKEIDEETNYEISDANTQDLPFKCNICRSSFVNPVVTKCLHYFCEKCALKQFKKDMRCYICKKQTNGVFTPAYKLLSKLRSYKCVQDVEQK